MSDVELSTHEKQDLYTLMNQWARNTDLQFKQVSEWFDNLLTQKLALAEVEARLGEANWWRFECGGILTKVGKVQADARISELERRREELKRANQRPA